MTRKTFLIATLILFVLLILKISLNINKQDNYLFYLDIISIFLLVLFYALLNQWLTKRKERVTERLFFIFHLLFLSALLPGYLGKEFIPIPYLDQIALSGSLLFLIISLVVIREQRKIYAINLVLFLFLNVGFLTRLILN